MVWTQGNLIMFRGVRTYRLTALGGGITKFEMIEVFSGLALPMAAGRLPDFKPIFERYAADLKAEAEQGGRRRSGEMTRRVADQGSQGADKAGRLAVGLEFHDR